MFDAPIYICVQNMAFRIVIDITETSRCWQLQPEVTAARTVASTVQVIIQPCLKTVWDVIARSVLCDEAITRRSSWPDKREIASPKNGSQ